jgi:hypothetical protein
MIAWKELRREWLDFHATHGISADPLSGYNGWHTILVALLEALIERPVTLGPFGIDGRPTEKKNLGAFDEMLRKANGDVQLVPLWLRIEHGSAHVPASVDLEQPPTDDVGYHMHAMANGYVWIVHSLPDTTVVILIKDDEPRASFRYD